MSLSSQLLIGPNPADLVNPQSDTLETSEKSKVQPRSPTVIILRKMNLGPSSKTYLTPFRVIRCIPGEPALSFYAVLCCSRPSHTGQLVNAWLSQKKEEEEEEMEKEPQEEVEKEPLPGFTFAFWALTRHENEFLELKLSVSGGLKPGQTLVFDGDNLPPAIMAGSRYIVTRVTNYSFDVCGPLVCPVLPFAADASAPVDSTFTVIKKSPVGR